MSSTSSNEWPPSSLAVNSSDIADACEDLQVLGCAVDATTAVVHMASLLHAQDWIAARHFYRRLEGNPLQSVLEPWYKVAAMALVDLSGVWSALQDLLTTTTTSTMSPLSAPLVATYVNEISHAFRLGCLKGWLNTNIAEIPSYYVTALGFSGMDELAAFLQQVALQQEPVSNNHTHVVSFLESRMTASSSLLTSTAAGVAAAPSKAAG